MSGMATGGTAAAVDPSVISANLCKSNEGAVIDPSTVFLPTEISTVEELSDAVLAKPTVSSQLSAFSFLVGVIRSSHFKPYRLLRENPRFRSDR